jgi:hypothetical protein
MSSSTAFLEALTASYGEEELFLLASLLELLKSGKVDTAMAVTLTVLFLRPEDVWSALSQTPLDTGRAPLMRPDVWSALSQMPVDTGRAPLCVYAAEACYELGRQEEAKKWCERAVGEVTNAWNAHLVGLHLLARAGREEDHSDIAGFIAFNDGDHGLDDYYEQTKDESWLWKDELLEWAKSGFRRGLDDASRRLFDDSEPAGLDYLVNAWGLARVCERQCDWKSLDELNGGVFDLASIRPLVGEEDYELSPQILCDLGYKCGHARVMIEMQRAAAGSEAVLQAIREAEARIIEANRQEHIRTRLTAEKRLQAILREEEQNSERLAAISAEMEQQAMMRREALERCGQEIGEYFFGAKWERLSDDVRTVLGTAELVYRQNRDMPGFSFAPVVVEFCKALELQLRQVLTRAGMPAENRGLTEISSLVEKVPGLMRSVPPGKVRALARSRNAAAHEGALIAHEQAEDVRNQVCQLISRLADITR